MDKDTETEQNTEIQQENDKNLFTAYINVWKNAFNYERRLSEGEYWLAYASQVLVILVIVGVFFGLNLFLPEFNMRISSMGEKSFFVLISIHIILIASMIMRHIYDRKRNQ